MIERWPNEPEGSYLERLREYEKNRNVDAIIQRVDELSKTILSLTRTSNHIEQDLIRRIDKLEKIVEYLSSKTGIEK